MKLFLPIKKLALVSLALPLLLGIFVLTYPPQNAQAAPAENCSQVINNKDCLEELKKQCTGALSDTARQGCNDRVVGKYTPVYSACRKKTNPQGCHKYVKKECPKGTKDILKCRKDKADNKYKDKVYKANVDGTFTFGDKPETNGTCGEEPNAVDTRFDFGCQGIGSPIEDVAYAIIRFLSVGVGLVLVASMVYAGIQYSSSEGSPEATQAAKKRIQNAIIGLVFYLFMFALVQYLVPGGLFN